MENTSYKKKIMQKVSLLLDCFTASFSEDFIVFKTESELMASDWNDYMR